MREGEDVGDEDDHHGSLHSPDRPRRKPVAARNRLERGGVVMSEVATTGKGNEGHTSLGDEQIGQGAGDEGEDTRTSDGKSPTHQPEESTFPTQLGLNSRSQIEEEHHGSDCRYQMGELDQQI
ncbi:MAG: hypothetical protein BWY75_02017 [bacterium ADurb.Bin425]|nr:MAG: hypothetical protein BWY75_02017 [bacterium ADurb.Bin425]